VKVVIFAQSAFDELTFGIVCLDVKSNRFPQPSIRQKGYWWDIAEQWDVAEHTPNEQTDPQSLLKTITQKLTKTLPHTY
jgi:hypothetical protein